jgi:hypothetical protein
VLIWHGVTQEGPIALVGNVTALCVLCLVLSCGTLNDFEHICTSKCVTWIYCWSLNNSVHSLGFATVFMFISVHYSC